MVSPATPRSAPALPVSTPSRFDALLKLALGSLLKLAMRVSNAPIGVILPVDSARAFEAVHAMESGILEPIALMQKLAQIQPSAALEVVLDASEDPRFVGLPALGFYIGVALTTERGQPLGTLCVIDVAPHEGVNPRDLEVLRDIAASVVSQLEHHSQALRLEEERDFYRAAAQSADFIAIATDALGRVTGLNPCAERALGVGSSEAQHRAIWALLPDPAAARLAQRVMRRILRGVLTTSHGELSWVADDGSTRHAALSCSVLRDAGGAASHVVITGVDTSALRRSELQMRRSAQAGAQALSAKGEFFNFVTHELRTPLHAISGYCDLLLDPGLGSLSPDQTDFAKEIRSASDHLFALISDLLDLSKLGTASIKFAPKPLNAAPLLRGCLSMLKTVAQQAGVILSLEMATGAASVYGDERSIKQILVNLLSNAVKFTPSGGRVRLSLSKDGDWQRLAVVDTGIGLLSDDLARIFEPFTQARNSPAHHRSFGLGLTLSRKLAELHGGRIEVSSRLGVGSSFTLILPSGPSDTLIGDTARGPEKHALLEQSGL